MRLISLLRDNKTLNELLCDFCDVRVIPDFRDPETQSGHLTYNISGKTFAKAKSGGEYILLQDNSVGYLGSEGQVGRISSNLDDFFELVINCPYWQNFIAYGLHEDVDDIRELTSEIYEEYIEDAHDFFEEEEEDILKDQKELAEKLGITLYDDIAKNVVLRFYNSAFQSPRFIATYTENDGSILVSSGSLFKIE